MPRTLCIATFLGLRFCAVPCMPWCVEHGAEAQFCWVVKCIVALGAWQEESNLKKKKQEQTKKSKPGERAPSPCPFSRWTCCYVTLILEFFFMVAVFFFTIFLLVQFFFMIFFVSGNRSTHTPSSVFTYAYNGERSRPAGFSFIFCWCNAWNCNLLRFIWYSPNIVIFVYDGFFEVHGPSFFFLYAHAYVR